MESESPCTQLLLSVIALASSSLNSFSSSSILLNNPYKCQSMQEIKQQLHVHVHTQESGKEKTALRESNKTNGSKGGVSTEKRLP